jgi:hypothetical protein
MFADSQSGTCGWSDRHSDNRQIELDDIGNCSRRASLASDAAEYKHIGQLEDGAFGAYKKFTGYISMYPGVNQRDRGCSK